MKLIFHTFLTYDNDIMRVYDSSGTEFVASAIHGTQSGRRDLIIHDNGAKITFLSGPGGTRTGFKIEYICHTLTSNGMHLSQYVTG